MTLKYRYSLFKSPEVRKQSEEEIKIKEKRSKQNSIIIKIHVKNSNKVSDFLNLKNKTKIECGK